MRYFALACTALTQAPTVTEASTAQFRELSARIRAEFARPNKSVAILGVQRNPEAAARSRAAATPGVER